MAADSIKTDVIQHGRMGKDGGKKRRNSEGQGGRKKKQRRNGEIFGSTNSMDAFGKDI